MGTFDLIDNLPYEVHPLIYSDILSSHIYIEISDLLLELC